MNQILERSLWVSLVIAMAFLFFLLGLMYAFYSMGQVASNIQIKNMEVQLNETKIVDAVMQYKEELATISQEASQ